MGFTTESRNYTKLVATAAYGSTDVSTRGLASDLFKNMVDNGFKLIYHNGGGNPAPDATNLWKATEVVFEPKSPTDDPINFVDPLGLTQTWRIGFAVQGYPNVATDGNELMAYLGTKDTMNSSTGIDRANSFPVVMLEGGSRQTDTRITATKAHGYRVSITTRGVAILIWNPKNIEDMQTMGLLCVQRPVKSDGSTLTDGFSPVFAVHNTDPLTGGRPRQSGRFFRTTVRERDVNLPQRPTGQIIQSKRHATAAIQFRSLTSTSGSVQHTFNINGATVLLGNGTSGAPQNHDNTRVYIAPPSGSPVSADPLINAAHWYATELSKVPHAGIKALTITASGPNILFYANAEGVAGNSIAFAKTYDNTNTFSVISPTNGFMAGGGGKPVPDVGSIKFNNFPSVGAQGYLTLGTGTGQVITFITGAPSGTAAQVTAGTSATQAAANFVNRMVQLQPVYSALQGVTFTLDPSDQTRVIVTNDTLATGSLWTQASATSDVTVSATLTGGNTNYASGAVNFFSVPPVSSVLNLNGVDITFVHGLATGDSQVSIGDPLNAYTLDQVLNGLLAKLSVHPSPKIQAGRYTIDTSATAPAPYSGRLNIQYATPGVEGNTYTMYTTTSQIEFTNVGYGFMTSLSGGAGFSPASDTAAYPDEISEQTGKFGASMYRLPNVWNAPVTTDTGEYVLVFPFGFCTEKVAYTEEMDMIAVSKGAAYQGVQNVNINVYNANRTYTSYNSNRETVQAPNNFVRIFLLTSGGGI